MTATCFGFFYKDIFRLWLRRIMKHFNNKVLHIDLREEASQQKQLLQDSKILNLLKPSGFFTYRKV